LNGCEAQAAKRTLRAVLFCSVNTGIARLSEQTASARPAG